MTGIGINKKQEEDSFRATTEVTTSNRIDRAKSGRLLVRHSYVKLHPHFLKNGTNGINLLNHRGLSVPLPVPRGTAIRVGSSISLLRATHNVSAMLVDSGKQ